MRAIILTIFFLSGACGLVYEVVWQRMLVLVFGSTAFATATILAAFMAGLALGSLVFGRLADRHRDPLRLFAYQEAGIALFAILAPFIFTWITGVYVSVYQHFQTTFYLLSLLRFALCFLVLLIPTFLMGGTLPVVSRLFVRRFDNLGSGVGSLYGSNTLGAVVGAFCAGFFFIVLFGVRETNYIAAATNVVVAGVAVGLTTVLASDTQNKADLEPRVAKQKRRSRDARAGGHQAYPNWVSQVVLGVYALSGFCALAYEVLWTRILVFFFHSTTYAFTIMLTTFLFGLALGSFAFARYVDRWRNPLTVLAIVQVLIGILAAFSIWEFGRLDGLVSSLSADAEGWSTFVVARYAGAFMIMLLPTLLMGLAFPLANKIYALSRESLGRSVGNVYSANTVGAVLGSFAAGFVIIPLIGITNGIALVASLNLLLGGVLVFFNPALRRTLKQAALAGMAIVVAAGILLFPSGKPLTLYSGVFADVEYGGEILYYDEGIGATLTVHQLPMDPYYNEAFRMLEVDGVNVAGTNPMLRLTQKLQGHLPLILYKASTGRDPRRVFTLGLASGESTYAIATHNIDRVDCAEIVSAQVETAAYFEDINRGILDNPKFSLVLNDARNYLLATQEEYDVIESDTTHPALSQHLFSREYFEIAQRRLSEHGLFSVWLPLYNTSEAGFKTLLKTFHSVFPYVTIWYATNVPTRHALLVGTKTELRIDFEQFRQELSRPQVNESLAEVGLDDVFTLLSCFITDQSEIGEYVQDTPVNSDNHPYLAFHMPKQKLREDHFIPQTVEAFDQLSLPVFPYLHNMGGAGPEIEATLEKHLQARRHAMRAIAYDFQVDFRSEVSEIEKALAVIPEDENIRRSLELAQVKLGFSHLSAFLRAGMLEEATQMCLEILQINPDFVPAHYDLALIYDLREEYAEALKELDRVISIDPDHVQGRHLLALIYAKTERYEEARTQVERVLGIAPDYEPARSLLNQLKASGN
jgi:spermidine synthase